MQGPKPKKKNIDTNRKNLVESSVLTAVGAIFILMGTYVPFLSFLTMFSAVPIVIITYRNKVSYALMSSFSLGVILSFFIHPINALFTSIMFFIPGVAIGFFAKENRPPFESIFYGFLSMTFTTALIIQFVSFFMDLNLIEYLMEILRESMEIQAELLKNLPSIEAVDINAITLTIRLLFPSFIVGFAIITSFLNYYMSAAIIRRLGEKKNLGSLLEFSMPGNVSVGIIVIYLLTYITSTLNFQYYDSLVANLTAVFILLFFLQGASVAGFFINKMKAPRLVKIAIVAMLIILAPISSFIALVGFVDALFNFRRLNR
ncbi:uncharacterized protein YybS (DUF2232 family) [Acetoanaerobium pronyense]|uniref:Uncharacterized protein YybS (DUF2232 family) n=1 Tax=Acetoanaerobium pronyense TaxID=1482736 RepID=A0ABS4KL83_9FIRM|nr:DUF2232 domain-containing protein [Acetoanaerobium pronyense]MBP2028543.1 uncharacterized protein YybS (DUF2232 family) [Acetoanaerobium pronyense]